MITFLLILTPLVSISGIVISEIRRRKIDVVLTYLAETVEKQGKYLEETLAEHNKQLATAGRALHIFEEETQILQKRREQSEKLKSRFQPRTPR